MYIYIYIYIYVCVCMYINQYLLYIHSLTYFNNAPFRKKFRMNLSLYNLKTNVFYVFIYLNLYRFNF